MAPQLSQAGTQFQQRMPSQQPQRMPGIGVQQQVMRPVIQAQQPRMPGIPGPQQPRMIMRPTAPGVQGQIWRHPQDATTMVTLQQRGPPMAVQTPETSSVPGPSVSNIPPPPSPPDNLQTDEERRQ